MAHRLRNFALNRAEQIRGYEMSQRTCNIVPNVRLTNTGKSVYSFQTTVLPPQTNRPIHVILLKTEHIKQNK